MAKSNTKKNNEPDIELTEKNNEPDRVLDEARKKAVKSTNVTSIFGAIYDVSVTSSKVILSKKKLG